MASDEDRRSAATLAAGVSAQIGAASLAMLSVLGAVLLFVVDKREPTIFSWISVGASFVAFVVSFFAGSTAVAAIYRKGHDGAWSYLAGDGAFQFQAYAAIIGLLLFPLGVASMGPATIDPETPRVQAALDSQEVRLAQVEKRNEELRLVIECLRKPAKARKC